MTAATPANARDDDVVALAAALRDLADSQGATAAAVRSIAASLGDPTQATRWADELVDRAVENRRNAAMLELGLHDGASLRRGPASPPLRSPRSGT